jgi:hypothetical protein
MVFIAHQHTPNVLELSEEPFHLPATFGPPEGAAILGWRGFPVRSMRRDHGDPFGRQRGIAWVTLVSRVPDQSFGAAIDKTRGERWGHKGDCVW